MIKLCSIVKRFSVQYGGSMLTNLQLHPFRSGVSTVTESYGSRCLHASTAVYDKNPASKLEVSEKLTAEEVDKKKDLPKILLLEKGRKVGTVTLDEAQHIAKKRNRKLVKVEESGRRSSQDVYQLLTSAQLQQEETKQATTEESRPKGSQREKNLVIGCKITDHDLEIKIKSIKKWLAQKYTIRITVNNDEANSAEKIFTALQQAAHEAGGKTSLKHKSSDGLTLKVIFQYNNKANAS